MSDGNTIWRVAWQPTERSNWLFRRIALPILIAVVSACLSIRLVESNDWLNRQEQQLTVDRQGYLAPADVKPIVIIGVDDPALSELRPAGAIGIPRSQYARLLYGLRRAGARAVLLDVYFEDPIQNEDDQLYAALRRCSLGPSPLPVVLLEDDPAPTNDPTSPDENAYEYRPPPVLSRGPLTHVLSCNATPIYAESSVVGVVPLRTTRVSKRSSLHCSVGSVLQFFRIDPKQVRREGKSLTAEPFSWGLGANDQIMAAWTPILRGFTEVGFLRALREVESSSRSEMFRDKLVIVGVTAQGVDDDKQIGSFGKAPGVYFVAQMVNTLLQSQASQASTLPIWMNWLTCFAMSFATAWALLSLRIPFAVGLSIAALMIGWFGPAAAAQRGLIMLYVPPICAVFLSVVLAALAAVAFGHFRDLRPRGFEEFCTILFVDLEDSTGLTQRYGAKGYERFHADLNLLWQRIVERHGGMIERTTGDGFMAVFRSTKDRGHALQCARCALEVVQPDQYFDGNQKSFTIPTIRAGFESGVVSGGYVFEGGRKAWSSAGKAVIVAQRIQSICKELDALAAAGPVAAELIAGSFEIGNRRQRQLKGLEGETQILVLR